MKRHNSMIVIPESDITLWDLAWSKRPGKQFYYSFAAHFDTQRGGLVIQWQHAIPLVHVTVSQVHSSLLMAGKSRHLIQQFHAKNYLARWRICNRIIGDKSSSCGNSSKCTYGQGGPD